MVEILFVSWLIFGLLFWVWCIMWMICDSVVWLLIVLVWNSILLFCIIVLVWMLLFLFFCCGIGLFVSIVLFSYVLFWVILLFIGMWLLVVRCSNISGCIFVRGMFFLFLLVIRCVVGGVKLSNFFSVLEECWCVCVFSIWLRLIRLIIIVLVL